MCIVFNTINNVYIYISRKEQKYMVIEKAKMGGVGAGGWGNVG